MYPKITLVNSCATRDRYGCFHSESPACQIIIDLHPMLLNVLNIFA